VALVVVGGLPGTGKSTLAESLAVELDAPVFAKDPLEASLWRSGIGTEQGSWQAAEDLMTTLAGEQLRRGRNAILDTVARKEISRTTWRELAATYDTRFALIECVCSDERVHESRLEGRVRAIPGWYEVRWADVVSAKQRWVHWTDERLVLDGVDPPGTNLERALEYVRSW
jgi:predicted kinase